MQNKLLPTLLISISFFYFLNSFAENQVNKNSKKSANSSVVLHDPTRPQNYQGDAPEEESGLLTVKLIYTSKDQRYALINDRFVHEGDMVLGNKVIKINQHEVILEGVEGKIVLPLIQGNIKQPVSNKQMVGGQ